MKRTSSRLIRILTLSVGLAVTAVLIAKVSFELSYDTCFKDADRICRINESVVRGSGDPYIWPQVSGGVAPAFERYIPQVEVATRITPVSMSDLNHDADMHIINGAIHSADTNVFKVFDWPVLSGSAEAALAQWDGGVVVSRRFAERLGGVTEAIDKTFWNEALGSGLLFTVRGVYEDFPVNSFLYGVDVLCSIAAMGEWSTNNTVGNDRYIGLAKLVDGVDPQSLSDEIDELRERILPLDELEKQGVSYTYTLTKVRDIHLGKEGVRSQVLILGIVAALLLILSVMNYVLIAIGDVVRRGKEVGVRKCYGAEQADIHGLLLKETAIDLGIALAVAALLIFAFRGMAESLLDVAFADMLSTKVVYIVAAVIVIVFLVSALLPAGMFMRIPISSAFRGYSESKRKWKLSLLAVQFAINAVLVSLLLIVSLQYRKVLRADPGYDYDNIIYSFVATGGDEQRMTVTQKLEGLPFVEGTALTYELPMSGGSGDDINLPGEGRRLFNGNDPYESSPGYFDLMGFTLLEGSWPKTADEVAVSESFREELVKATDWRDGIIGRQVDITGHNIETFTICGVYGEYLKGDLTSSDDRPKMFFVSNSDSLASVPLFTIVAKLSEVTAENIAQANEVLKEVFPDSDVEFTSYAESFHSNYASTRNMRRTYVLGSVVALIIALVGLIGYVRDENWRRSKEIAVRKVNGAVTGEIVMMLVLDILKIAVAAVVVGDILAYFVASRWLSQFSEQITLNPMIFVVADIVVLLIVVATVVANSLSIARGNPVESLKNE